MSNKNEVFEYLIDQLRQQLPVVDVMGEIERWSIDRSIAGRGNYTDEENAVIDAYIGLEHNPYKQQCEDLAHEVQSLKNQLRDASALVAELQKGASIPSKASPSVNSAAWKLHDALVAKGPINGAQFNILKVAFYDAMLTALGKSEADTEQSGFRKEDAHGCEHEWQFYGVGFPCMCLKCGLKK